MIKIDWKQYVEHRCWFGWWYLEAWTHEEKSWLQEWQRFEDPAVRWRIINWNGY